MGITEKIVHPLRDEPLVVYENAEYGAVGFFGIDKKYPVYITGKDKDEVYTKGEAFRSSLLEKYEQSYILRVKQAAKARSRRKK